MYSFLEHCEVKRVIVVALLLLLASLSDLYALVVEACWHLPEVVELHIRHKLIRTLRLFTFGSELQVKEIDRSLVTSVSEHLVEFKQVSRVVLYDWEVVSTQIPKIDELIVVLAWKQSNLG